jgi:ornithine carbamoyltransferase
MKHVISDWDLTPEQVTKILETSEQIKANPTKYSKCMEGKTLIMLFELASLRTRISFEAGMTQLGGHAIMYGVENQGFSRSETLGDGIAVLARYGDMIMARVLKQDAMVEIGESSTVPVINGMTEAYHPCQNLADLLTIKEKKGVLEGLKIVYVGDGGCNTAASTIIGCKEGK